MTGRPEALFPLFAKLETLEGVGPKTAQNFAQLGVIAPRDLLFTLTYSGIDRRLQPSVKDAILPATVTVAVTVGAHRAPANKGGVFMSKTAPPPFNWSSFTRAGITGNGRCPKGHGAWCRGG